MFKLSALQSSALVGILASITLAARVVFAVSEAPTVLKVPINELKTDWVSLPIGSRLAPFSTVIYPGDTDVWVTTGTNYAGDAGAGVLNAASDEDIDSLMQGVASSANTSRIFAYDCRLCRPLGSVAGIQDLRRTYHIP